MLIRFAQSVLIVRFLQLETKKGDSTKKERMVYCTLKSNVNT
jgi:hypothetical protein